jgi:hypothetical protein
MVRTSVKATLLQRATAGTSIFIVHAFGISRPRNPTFASYLSHCRKFIGDGASVALPNFNKNDHPFDFRFLTRIRIA